MAASGARGDFTVYDEGAQGPGWVPPNSPVPDSSPLASDADFVRALKNCRLGSRPHFRKGDILRVINKTRRSGLSGELKRFENGLVDTKAGLSR